MGNKITTTGGILIKGNDVLFDFSNTTIEFETLRDVSFTVECQVSDVLEDKYSGYMAYVYLAVFVDGQEVERIKVKPTTPQERRKLSFEKHHRVKLVKLSEAFTGIACLKDLLKCHIKAVPKEEKVKVEFIGASLTSGYGNDNGREGILDTDWLKTWGSYLCTHFNWEALVHSYSCMGIIRDSSMNTKNQLMERRRRIIGCDKSTVFDFSTFPASYVIINVGSNDFAGGLTPEFREEFIAKLKSLIEEVYQQYGEKLVVMLLDGPMTRDTLGEIYKEVVASYDGSGKKVFIINAKLEFPNDDLWGYWGHPTDLGHVIMFEQLLPQVEKIIQSTHE